MTNSTTRATPTATNTTSYLAASWVAEGDDSTVDGMTLLEAVCWAAGERRSDHPDCVCPVLAVFGRLWNDGMRSNDERSQLRRYINRLINTRHTSEVVDERRSLASKWLINEYAPTWLDLAGLNENS